MENRTRQQHFTAIVIGDNHSELIKQYGPFKVEPYIVANYDKADQYRAQRITSLRLAKYYQNEMCEKDGRPIIFDYDTEIDRIKNMDPTDFYLELGEDHKDWYMDEETGAYMSELNPKCKYDAANIGKSLSMPLVLKDGSDSFSEKKCNIDWTATHLSQKDIYEIAWDTVMGGKEPITDQEKKIYENMKSHVKYFQYFGTRENYVLSSTAFWGYAYVDQNGWIDIDDEEKISQTEWMRDFYKKFIVPLNANDRITVYECFRND